MEEDYGRGHDDDVDVVVVQLLIISCKSSAKREDRASERDEENFITRNIFCWGLREIGTRDLQESVPYELFSKS